MARFCESCKYYDPAGSQEACPACSLPMRFTLLPPPGQAPAALPLEAAPKIATRAPRPQLGSSFSGPTGPWLGLPSYLFRPRLLLSLVVVPILMVLKLGLGVNLTEPSLQEKVNQLEIGMDADEVKAIMDPPVRSRRMPVRHRSMFDEIPDEGSTTLNWKENGSTATLEFKDGELVGKSLKPDKQ